MAFSFFKCFVPSADSSSLNLQNDNPSSSPERALVPLRNSQSLPITAPASSNDQLSGSLTSRSGKGMVVCSFAIAATTAIGLSICSLDCFAIAAQLEMNNTAILSVGNVHSSPSLKLASVQDPIFTLTSKPSAGSNTDPDLSFSMAIPIPHKKVWGHAQSGFIAPLPHIHEHGLVMPFSRPRKTAVVPESSTLKCPQWTPSELEMVLPDFHGRPKPFPHKGHHWLASFVMKGIHSEAFLQLSDLNAEIELNELDEKTTISVEDNTNKQQNDGEPSLRKVLGMERCFSM